MGFEATAPASAASTVLLVCCCRRCVALAPLGWYTLSVCQYYCWLVVGQQAKWAVVVVVVDTFGVRAAATPAPAADSQCSESGFCSTAAGALPLPALLLLPPPPPPSYTLCLAQHLSPLCDAALFWRLGYGFFFFFFFFLFFFGAVKHSGDWRRPRFPRIWVECMQWEPRRVLQRHSKRWACVHAQDEKEIFSAIFSSLAPLLLSSTVATTTTTTTTTTAFLSLYLPYRSSSVCQHRQHLWGTASAIAVSAFRSKRPSIIVSRHCTVAAAVVAVVVAFFYSPLITGICCSHRHFTLVPDSAPGARRAELQLEAVVPYRLPLRLLTTAATNVPFGCGIFWKKREQEREARVRARSIHKSSMHSLTHTHF